jgi:hypothetical protein
MLKTTEKKKEKIFNDDLSILNHNCFFYSKISLLRTGLFKSGDLHFREWTHGLLKHQFVEK